jgi:DNA-binding response OmpR family regulator
MAHILVVDDEPLIRAFVGWHLEKEGHTVSEALNGMDAWRQTRHIRFDLLTTDLMMPEIVGEDLVRLLEKDSATAAMPILVLGNMSPDRETYENSCVPIRRAQGVILLIKKPFNPQQMLQMVRFSSPLLLTR